MIGKQYIHTNGNIYTVLCLTNEHASQDNQNKYPTTVVYIGQNGKLWSRRLED